MVNLEKSFIYRIQEGDDFKTLFQKFNTSYENIFRNNSDIPLYSGEIVEIQQILVKVQIKKQDLSIVIILYLGKY